MPQVALGVHLPSAAPAQYLGDLGCNYVVFKNDEKTVEEIKAMDPKGVMVSPGPGRLLRILSSAA